jgi:hypothetical protein
LLIRLTCIAHHQTDPYLDRPGLWGADYHLVKLKIKWKITAAYTFIGKNHSVTIYFNHATTIRSSSQSNKRNLERRWGPS